MNKLIRLLSVLLCTSTLLFGLSACNNGSSDSEKTTESNSSNEPTKLAEGYWRIYLLDKPAGETWQIWAWKDAAVDVNYDTNGWPGGDFVLDKSDSYGSYCDMKLDTSADFGLLFVNSAGSPQTNDVIVPKEELLKYNTFYFNFANPKVYYTSYKDCFGLMGANLVTETEISITTSRIESLDLTKLTVKDSDGNVLEIESATLEKIVLKSGNVDKTPYTVEYDGKIVSCPLTGDVVDNLFGVEDNDFGVTLGVNKASFKMWAPLASSVKVLLFKDSSNLTTEEKTVDMTKGEKGIWTATDVDTTGMKYYKYRIANPDGTKDVCDIWAKSCSADSVASQLVDINEDTSAIPDSTSEVYDGTVSSYENPFGKNGTETKTYSDAVIYEMHIRDWSRAFVTDSTGKYLDLANSEDFIDHLIDLGITHVQILPSFDHAETNANTAYNFGYNPYHYNVPEGRYVTKNYTDGTQAVKEFRTLISKLHEAGIAVNMDVVYNHTSGINQYSLYDLTVPEYFYRTADGTYVNGSGCGNELATNHKVVKTYVIESLKHWMLDYHINGFRFDLMGCHEAETMADIYDELYAIDPNVMVYGEPWTGGSSAVVDGAVKAGEGTDGIGYGAFDDDYRNAIKGGEFGGFKKGQVQGTFGDVAIKKGLTGASTTRNDTGKPELSLHYVECHDNYTLFDKLAMSYIGITECKEAIDLFKAVEEYDTKNSKQAGTGLETIKAENKLAAAYIFLSQGTPFINGGQEFMRTKKGNENSYNSSDEINQINISMKDTYSDVYNVYKGLISFRKANPEAFGNNTSAVANNMKDDANKSIKGYTQLISGDFCVYFNATDNEQTCDTTGYSKVVDVTSGTPAESTTLPSSVPAKGFVILKK